MGVRETAGFVSVATLYTDGRPRPVVRIGSYARGSRSQKISHGPRERNVAGSGAHRPTRRPDPPAPTVLTHRETKDGHHLGRLFFYSSPAPSPFFLRFYDHLKRFGINFVCCFRTLNLYLSPPKVCTFIMFLISLFWSFIKKHFFFINPTSDKIQLSKKIENREKSS